MRKRIFFFHTLTLITALVVLLAVNGGVVHWISGFYQGQEIPAADDQSGQVQAILGGWSGRDGDWRELNRQLEGLGYRLVVEREHQVIYSTLDQFQDEMYHRVSARASWPAEGTLTVQNQGMMMVGRNSGGVTLVAMPQPHLPEVLGRQRPQMEAAMLSMLVSGVMAIGVILFLSLLFTRYQVKQILRPVQDLALAAKRVEEGDFSTPLNYDKQDEFVAVYTAFDHMQRHLQQEREKNDTYERARTDLVAGISHDLRTPLTSVKGYIKGMQDGVANTPEKRGQYLDIAYRKACDMERLLQRLFYFSKLETGSLPLMPTQADLGGFVQHFVDDVGGELASMGGEIVVRGVPAPHPVQLDQEQMYRVLTNLKENAIRYAGARPLVLTLTVWRQRDREWLRFADNGQGVPPENLPHLFEQFWRGDQARGSQNGQGSGLGLYIVKYIVEAHGGTIRAENNQGLVFELSLPCEEALHE